MTSLETEAARGVDLAVSTVSCHGAESWCAVAFVKGEASDTSRIFNWAAIAMRSRPDCHDEVNSSDYARCARGP
jgi:hypothetical protein